MAQFDQVKPGIVALVGIPLDENSSFLRGAAEAPAKIREAWHSDASSHYSESGKEIVEGPDLCDVGDLELTRGEFAMRQITGEISKLYQRGARVLTLGGDHSITYPLVKACASVHPYLNILHFDAHPDLYENFENNRYSHASPFARIMEEGLTTRLIQVGIRATNPQLRAQAARFDVETVEMRDWKPGGRPDLEGPTYLSLDLDVFDPAFAPGVSHHEPGGMTVREVIDVIQRIDAPIVGADIVELNPTRDHHGRTAAVAAKMLKEIASVMMANG